MLSGSFDANIGLWFYSRFISPKTLSLCSIFRFNTQTPDHYSLLGWELFRLRSVTGEEDLFFVSLGGNLFSSFAPSLKENNKGTFYKNSED